MKLILIAFVTVLAFCLVASAQSVITNVSYVGSNNSRISGLDSNGLSLELLGAVDGTGDMVLSARHQRTIADAKDRFSVSSRYSELSGQFLVPRLNHYLIVGVAKLNSTTSGITEFRGSDVRREYQSKFVAPVVGLGGQQRLGDAVFNYSWRLFPRASRTSRESLGSESRSWSQNPSTGTELRGAVTHMIRPRVGFGGEVFWQRVAPDMRDYGFKIGTTLVLIQ